jgi:hypothetical protein
VSRDRVGADGCIADPDIRAAIGDALTALAGAASAREQGAEAGEQ